jgi:hypothetical protein
LFNALGRPARQVGEGSVLGLTGLAVTLPQQDGREPCRSAVIVVPLLGCALLVVLGSGGRQTARKRPRLARPSGARGRAGFLGCRRAPFHFGPLTGL